MSVTVSFQIEGYIVDFSSGTRVSFGTPSYTGTITITNDPVYFHLSAFSTLTNGFDGLSLSLTIDGEDFIYSPFLANPQCTPKSFPLGTYTYSISINGDSINSTGVGSISTFTKSTCSN